MNERKWLLGFVSEAERDPRRLLKTLRQLPAGELNVGAEVVGYVRNPVVRALGYVMLAQRGYKVPDVIDVIANAIGQLPEDDRPEVVRALRDVYLSKRDGLIVQVVDALEPHLPKYEFKKLRQIARQSPGRTMDRQRIRKLEVHGVRGLSVERFSQSEGTLPDPNAAAAIADVFGRMTKPRKKERAVFSVRKSVEYVNYFDWELSAPSTLGAAERVVNSGFAESAAPDTPSMATLRCSTSYWFWIEIGEPVEGSLEVERTKLQDFVRAGMKIEVVLFTNGDGVRIEGLHVGAFELQENSKVRVSAPAAAPAVPDSLRSERLFFQIVTPDEPRRCGMRCSFYCNGLLIQSREIRMPVGVDEPPSIVADYVLARTLAAAHLAALEPPRLSLMVNESAGGSHDFRFYSDYDGEKPYTNSVRFSDAALQDLIAAARRGLRKVSWGTEAEWKGEPYRYEVPGTVDTLFDDLADLARRGRVAWDAIVDQLGKGPDGRDELEKLMRRSGSVQFALRESASAVVPVAMLYDYPLDTALPKDQLKICKAFKKSLSKATLEDEPCFNGECPSLLAEDVLCVGGFWGFRHAIGVPVSIGSHQDSPPDTPVFVCADAGGAAVLLSMDPDLLRREDHVQELKRLFEPTNVSEARTRNDAITLMNRKKVAPVVYFYCHGGDDDVDGPYLEVGEPGEPWIARNTFGLKKIRWRDPRPLVFINGCHTTNVEPERAINLVGALVSSVGAAGVIGSEITVFESLAVRFAEFFFEEFVNKGRAAGVAVRLARLRILKDTLNLLGLVYIPFVLPSLRLRPPSVPTRP